MRWPGAGDESPSCSDEHRMVNWEPIGKQLHVIQADQRSLRDAIRLVDKRVERLDASLSRFATRDEVLDVVQVLADRIGGFEAHIDTRLDELASRLGAIESRLPPAR